MLHYGFSKAAVLAVSRGLAKRVAGNGVTVNALLPGPTLSEGVAEMLAGDAEDDGRSLEQAGEAFVRAERPTSLLRRATSPEEVANMAVYLCSQQASATTGAAVRADGGVVDDII
jgi:NAD(P)-dependent dehydrogenase (short-subunit alcohol dehydrogenase family)